jgi:hypothetical protein
LIDGAFYALIPVDAKGISGREKGHIYRKRGEKEEKNRI